VLLGCQEFATPSVAVFFFDMPPRWRCRWRISVGVKARVVNWKQVDVAASRSFDLSWNALIAHCMQRDGRGARDGLTKYSCGSPIVCEWEADVRGEGERCRRLISPCVHAGIK